MPEKVEEGEGKGGRRRGLEGREGREKSKNTLFVNSCKALPHTLNSTSHTVSVCGSAIIVELIYTVNAWRGFTTRYQ